MIGDEQEFGTAGKKIILIYSLYRAIHQALPKDNAGAFYAGRQLLVKGITIEDMKNSRHGQVRDWVAIPNIANPSELGGAFRRKPSFESLDFKYGVRRQRGSS